MKNKTKLFILLVKVGVFCYIIVFLSLHNDKPKINQETKQQTQHTATCEERALSQYGLETNTCKISVPFDKILSGGPPKDGIPAINNPQFIPYNQSNASDTTRGILININNKQRFYPYNILAYHEIVNDKIDDTHYSVTFCPLCDAGIVFDRTVNDEVLQFGVSGLLYESNLLMYDTKTESLWSQAGNRAVAGDYTGTQLNILPFQLLSFKEVKEKYSQGVILSEDTGFNRDYNRTPYSGYLENELLYFPISVNDQRFPTKELMYVIPFNDKSITFPYKQFKEGTQMFNVSNKEIKIQRLGNEIYTTSNGENYPGYFELWFSWAIHHQNNGIVLSINK